jgi:hypothetical protein
MANCLIVLNDRLVVLVALTAASSVNALVLLAALKA